jgi:hypothetical protein
MTDANNLFREHVTSTAFNLSLSKNMIAMLAWVASENNPADDLKAAQDRPHDEYMANRKRFVAVCGRYDTVTCGNALLRRGLIWSPYEKWPGIYCLTDAGKHVFELLRIAGLVEALGFEDLAA